MTVTSITSELQEIIKNKNILNQKETIDAEIVCHGQECKNTHKQTMFISCFSSSSHTAVETRQHSDM